MFGEKNKCSNTISIDHYFKSKHYLLFKLEKFFSRGKIKAKRKKQTSITSEPMFSIRSIFFITGS